MILPFANPMGISPFVVIPTFLCIISKSHAEAFVAFFDLWKVLLSNFSILSQYNNFVNPNLKNAVDSTKLEIFQ
jgi:hypothetical protein